MTLTVLQEPELTPEVAEFLRQHSAEAAFRVVNQLVGTCFPELCSIDVRLMDDPDEEDRRWVVCHVLLPASYPPDQLQTQRLRYYEELVSRLSFQERHLFGLILDFIPE